MIYYTFIKIYLLNINVSIIISILFCKKKGPGSPLVGPCVNVVNVCLTTDSLLGRNLFLLLLPLKEYDIDAIFYILAFLDFLEKKNW